MADKKISALTGATTPLAGTEVLPIVQGGSTVKVSIANVTAGRAVSTGALSVVGANVTLDNAFSLVGKLAGGTSVGMMRRNSSDEVAIDEDGYGTKIGFGGRYNFAGGGDFTVGIGNVIMGTAGKGIDFSANTNLPGATSELLDWYEEGTWTIVDVSGAGLSLTIDHAKYTRVGNLVTVNAYVTYPVTASVLSATLSLPFTAAAYDIGTAGASNGAVFSIITTGGTNAMTVRDNSLVSITNAAISGANVLMSFTYMV